MSFIFNLSYILKGKLVLLCGYLLPEVLDLFEPLHHDLDVGGVQV